MLIANIKWIPYIFRIADAFNDHNKICANGLSNFFRFVLLIKKQDSSIFLTMENEDCLKLEQEFYNTTLIKDINMYYEYSAELYIIIKDDVWEDWYEDLSNSFICPF